MDVDREEVLDCARRARVAADAAISRPVGGAGAAARRCAESARRRERRELRADPTPAKVAARQKRSGRERRWT